MSVDQQEPVLHTLPKDTSAAATIARWKDRDLHEALTTKNLEVGEFDSLREYVIQLGILSYQNLQTPEMKTGLEELGFIVYPHKGADGCNNSIEVDLQGEGYPFIRLEHRLSPVDPSKNKFDPDNQDYDSSWTSITFSNYPFTLSVTSGVNSIYGNPFYVTTEEKPHQTISVDTLPMNREVLDTLLDGVSLLVAANSSPGVYHATILEMTRRSLGHPDTDELIEGRVSRLEDAIPKLRM